jgi:hypothetical protein
VILFFIIASFTPIYLEKISKYYVNNYIISKYLNIYFFKFIGNICDSKICINNGICSELNGTCRCLSNEYFGDSCQYCKL